MDINFVPKFIDKGLTPPAQAIGSTLTDLWNLGIGNHISLWSEKQKVKQEHNLIDYKRKIENETQNIPEINLTEPNLHIIGPALEASKYYIESEELRGMFAKLIAASIDNRKSYKTHPSFVEIIKQMSPLDAQNISLFKDSDSYPIGQYNIKKESGGSVVFQKNVFLENQIVNNLDFDLIASSIENLSRLGLLNIDLDRYLLAEHTYDKFQKTEDYISLQKLIEENEYPEFKDIELKKGIVDITPFGKDFIEICL